MKLLKTYLFATAALCLPVSAFSAEIKDLTAGRLKDAATSIAKTETILKISGTINAADFSYIQDNFNDLKELDLSGATIVSYSGERLPYTGLSSSGANALPAYSLTGLTSLTKLTLPKSLKSIDKGSLSGSGITSLVIPDGVESIGEYAFLRCNNLEEINIPASISSIGERAFAYCGKLNKVTVSSNTLLPSIPEGMFEASGIKQLNLKDLAACNDIGPWALAECNGLTTLVLPEKTQTIGNAALMGTSSIQTLGIPASTDYIADNAMANMTGLNMLDASKTINVPYLGENVWRNVEQDKVTLLAPEELINEFKETDQWKDFKIITKAELTIDIINSHTNTNTLKIKRDGNNLIIEGSAALGRVSIYNVNGKLVAGANTPKKTSQFRTSGWAQGVYLIISEAGIAKITI